MSASLTVPPSDPWDTMTPASASPRIDPSTPIQHAIIKANETNQTALRIVFICRPPSRICRALHSLATPCLQVMQTHSTRVFQHPYPPLPVLPQPAHETVERRAQLRHQVAVADKERLYPRPRRAGVPTLVPARR